MEDLCPAGSGLVVVLGLSELLPAVRCFTNDLQLRLLLEGRDDEVKPRLVIVHYENVNVQLFDSKLLQVPEPSFPGYLRRSCWSGKDHLPRWSVVQACQTVANSTKVLQDL